MKRPGIGDCSDSPQIVGTQVAVVVSIDIWVDAGFANEYLWRRREGDWAMMW